MKTLHIFGATGSIGSSTLAVVTKNKNLFSLETVTANSNAEKLAQIAIEYKAKHAVIADEKQFDVLKKALSGTNITYAAGRAAIKEAASRPADMMMAAITGIAGLPSVYEYLKQGKRLLLANKESMVTAGDLMKRRARESGAEIIPVDSEHNGVFQCFEEQNRDKVSRIILTASGGPFYETPANELQNVTVEQALKHPNWSMGAKISVDSATMMNKALEVIEAAYLFDLPPAQVDVLVHRQSIIHALVEYNDGSLLAHMGMPDMQTAIAHAMAYPARLNEGGKRIDITALAKLTLVPPDTLRFPSVKLAYHALGQGSEACIALNAANEAAVGAFLQKTLSFQAITRTVEKTLEKADNHAICSPDEVLDYHHHYEKKAQEIWKSF